MDIKDLAIRNTTDVAIPTDNRGREATEVKHITDLADDNPENVQRYPLGFMTLDQALNGGFKGGDLVVVSGVSGQGKCLAKGTPVLMFDGSIKNVEDIKVGDKIMGDDSTPRIILSLARGREDMFDVIPVKGDKYTVNRSHILSLTNCSNSYGGKGKRDISVDDYLKLTDSNKNVLKGYRVKIEFKKRSTPIDPYFLGCWLGDGSSHEITISNPDKEIIKYLKDYCERGGLKIKNSEKRKGFCPVWRITGFNGREKTLLNNFKKLNVFNNKHIPNVYKINDRKTRLELLAGLIDTDGHLFDNCYEIITKSEQLRDDILYLTRSLGFASSTKLKKGTIKSINFVGYYHKIIISGDIVKIPVKIKRKKGAIRKQIKNVLHTGITLKSVGVGDYYGFEIDGNKRFLLGDFTVTHNTTFMRTLTYNLTKFNVQCLWFSYEVSLNELHRKFAEMKIADHYHVYTPTKLVTGEIEWIREKIIESTQKYGTKVIFIDHIDFLTPKNTRNSDNETIALKKIVTELKSLANELEVIIILAAHVKKLPDNRQPEMQDIGYSAGIFQLADSVFIVYRHKLEQAMGEELEGDLFSNISTIKIVKNRDTGILKYIKCIYEDERYKTQADVGAIQPTNTSDIYSKEY